MKSVLTGILFLLFLWLMDGAAVCEGKKIKYSFSKEKEFSKTKKLTQEDVKTENVDVTDTVALMHGGKEEFLNIQFAGYDKEINSSKESFIIVNPTEYVIKGYEVRIDYLDMQGRMLHSRTEKRKCEVPPGESRKFDISSWDTQHTYFYYLGNEPKKVATPFQVKFIPLSFDILEGKSN